MAADERVAVHVAVVQAAVVQAAVVQAAVAGLVALAVVLSLTAPFCVNGMA